jgi:hypothetical protein
MCPHSHGQIWSKKLLFQQQTYMDNNNNNNNNNNIMLDGWEVHSYTIIYSLSPFETYQQGSNYKKMGDKA